MTFQRCCAELSLLYCACWRRCGHLAPPAFHRQRSALGHRSMRPPFAVQSVDPVVGRGSRAARLSRALETLPSSTTLEGTFTFSEPMLLLGVTLSPLWCSGHRRPRSKTWRFCASWPATASPPAALALALGAPRGAALLAALAGVTLPYTAKVLGFSLCSPSSARSGRSQPALRREDGCGGPPRGGPGVAAQFLAGQQMALLSLPFLLLAGVVALAEQRVPRPVDRGRSVSGSPWGPRSLAHRQHGQLLP